MSELKIIGAYSIDEFKILMNVKKIDIVENYEGELSFVYGIGKHGLVSHNVDLSKGKNSCRIAQIACENYPKGFFYCIYQKGKDINLHPICNPIMKYGNKIRELKNPSFQQIRRIANESIKYLSEAERNRLWEELKRGTALLDSHELLCQYLWSFGNMHEAKIRVALQNMPIEELNGKSIQIIDWGCGQGLATICFLEFLEGENVHVEIDKVVLIEPSTMALSRAKLYVSTWLDEDKIKTIPKYINNVECCDIESDSEITIHMFSNILDIPSIDLQQLTKSISVSIYGIHYFLCVSPTNGGQSRLDVFYNYFKNPYILFDEEHGKDSEHKFTAKYKIFKVEEIGFHYENIKPVIKYNHNESQKQVEIAKKEIEAYTKEQTKFGLEKIDKFQKGIYVILGVALLILIIYVINIL